MKRILSLAILVLGLVVAVSATAVPVPKAPSVTADTYVLMDAGTGRVLAADDADRRHVLSRKLCDLHQQHPHQRVQHDRQYRDREQRASVAQLIPHLAKINQPDGRPAGPARSRRVTAKRFR